MNKYEFIKKDIDTYILKYKDKSIEFKTNIGIASKIQKHQEMAEIKLVMDLAKQGMTVNDLKIEKVNNGKKYVDMSSYDEIKNKYKNNALNEVFDEICLDLFNYKLADLALDIGLETADDGIIFTNKLMTLLTGGNIEETPSQEENKEQD